jgi:hypothetical protein
MKVHESTAKGGVQIIMMDKEPKQKKVKRNKGSKN